MAESLCSLKLSAHHRAKGRAMALAGASICSHNLPIGSAALQDWLAGFESVTPPRSHIAAPVRQRFDARQECAA